jgi:hypothetical protein
VFGFGESSSREMPSHLFYGALHIDHDTAVKADIRRQDFSVCPRQWYVDAVFSCRRCGEKFRFSADEQWFWYEECRFYVDSAPRECPSCRRGETKGSGVLYFDNKDTF